MSNMNELDLEYKIIGKDKTVLVIETGIGSSFYDWYSIVEDLKEDFTIVLYHRCGYGKSQDPKTPRTTKNIAEELNYLLDKIGIKDKFIVRSVFGSWLF
ncbi:alpha/beta fold hydrolase, partial [Clostridium sp.]|uniref:alpha/beta fold hydrolase n=1 Tax=Clostridium sp. TaxID=1506 RepID=UPI003217302D